MNRECDELLAQLPDYMKGELSSEEKAAFETRLMQSKCKDEFDSLRQVWQKLSELPDAQPGPAIETRFYAMLEAYKAGQSHSRVGFREALDNWLERWWPRRPATQFGLALTLLIAGLFGGELWRSQAAPGDIGTLRGEVASLRQMVAVSLLKSDSPSDRLRGLSYSNLVDRPDEETLNELLNTLNYDPNLNVRLASVEALSAFSDREKIRRGLQQSLERQTSPALQIALIDLLEVLKDKRSVPVLNDLSEDNKVNTSVRKRAGQAIERLK